MAAYDLHESWSQLIRRRTKVVIAEIRVVLILHVNGEDNEVDDDELDAITNLLRRRICQEHVHEVCTSMSAGREGPAVSMLAGLL